VLERGVLKDIIPIVRAERDRDNKGSYLDHARQVLGA
jgi:hypothetical protein